MTTTQNRIEPPVNRKVSFEAIPYLSPQFVFTGPPDGKALAMPPFKVSSSVQVLCHTYFFKNYISVAGLYIKNTLYNYGIEKKMVCLKKEVYMGKK